MKKSKTDFKSRNPLEIRSAARKFALDTVDKQKSHFESWGVFGDWSNPYLTLSPDYVKNQLRLFHSFVEKGLLFRRYMPVYWSPVSQTALAESELEYKDNHKSKAVFVRFKLKEASAKMLNLKKETYAVIWTTTPWSLPANRAICYDPNAKYSIFELNNSYYMIASALSESLAVKSFLNEATFVTEFSGSQLLNLEYENKLSSKFYKEQSECFRFLPSDHVTMDTGTGLVHTAPSHGKEDYSVGVEFNLDLSCPVDHQGRYVENNVNSDFVGLNVLKEGSEAVLRCLHDQDDVLLEQDFIHSYPHDWRSKTPVILRASMQWFIDVSSLKEEAMDIVKEMNVQPESAKNRFLSVIANRPYWCVSRQRVWGCPIPVLYKKNSEESVINQQLIEHFCGLIDKHGTDFWWKLELNELLEGTDVNPNDVTKGNDILDVWFDSGISWSTLDGQRSDVYLEGLDQFSGWFYSSLLTCLAETKSSPFKKLFAHGFTLDEKGLKMSKSLGNVISPQMVIEGKLKKAKGEKSFPYGVDCMRYWVAAHASQKSSGILLANSALVTTKEELDRLRNVCKYLIGNLNKFDVSNDVLSYEQLLPLDKQILHQLSEFYLSAAVENYDDLKINFYCLKLQNFLANLSNEYFHPIKDRLYCEEKDSLRRKSAQTALYHILEVLKDSFAPICPILASEVEMELPFLRKSFEIGHSLELLKSWNNQEVINMFNKLKKIEETCVENKIKLAVDDHLILNTKNSEFKNFFETSDLVEYFRISKVTFTDEPLSELSTDDFQFEIKKTDLHFCPRCRLHRAETENNLCTRCSKAEVANVNFI